MIDPIWSWWLTAFAVTAIWVGPHNRWGWIVGALGQCLWFAYGIHSHQHGFVASALLLAGGYIRNFFNARRKRGRLTRIRRSSGRWRMKTRGSAAHLNSQRNWTWSVAARPMLLLTTLLFLA